ncbi:MAG: energy-coupling factor ABC transporter ATP-binding protein [Desulfohalobiaceae bacterium]|nr:energy-coupling factor ABC transporter ATP-binding protein [Desulfohalobiaceae bacterium]
MSIYRLENIQQRYAGRLVLDIEHLEVERGSILGLYGPNGSGKSTLLRIMALLEDPVAGRLIFQGKEAGTGDDRIRRRITLLDQNPYLLKRSVRANVAYGLKVRGEKEHKTKINQVLELVGLPPEHFSERSWHQLSGGEAQRVALAARLVLKPAVLLLDEPTANLDEESTERIRRASLAARQKWGTTIILVSHDRSWLEGVSDSFLLMENGRFKLSEN